MALTKPRAYQIYDIDYKQATRVITVLNITLSGGAPSQVDGVNLSLNDRVLVTGQTNKAQNGIYDVDTVGSGANGTWVRSGDTNTTGELLAGTIVMVTEGVIYADTQWKLTTNDPITIGVSELVFEQNSAFAFGNVNANGTAVLANSVGSTLNLTAGDNISITGNNTSKTVTIGVTGISLNSISNGTSNVNVVSSGGNVTVGIGGTSNVAVFSSTGANITGTLGVSGNITGGNLSGTSIAGTLTTASQTNITSVGTLGSLTVTANVAGGNLTTAGQVVATGNITGGNLKTSSVTIGGTGAISGVTTISASGNANVGNIGATNAVFTNIAGTLTTAAQTNITSVGTLGSLSVTGNITSGNVSGTRGAFTNLAGTLETASQPNITSVGTLSSLTVTANVAGGNLTTAGQVVATGNIGTTGTININSSSGMYNVLNITGTALGPYGGSQTWKFFTQNAVAGGPGSWILFPDSSTQTTAYPGTTSTLSLSGNITGGNLISDVAVVATGNITGGNLITAGLISATGNITGGNILGNGAGLSGINAFSTVAVTGGNSAVADSIADTLTIAAGSGISLVMDSSTDTLTIAASGTGESIFSTGGQMGLITETVTVSEDLGLVTEVPAAEEYDLGGLFIDGFVGNPNFLPNSIYGNILVADAVISTTGNITAGYFIGNGSALTGVVAGAPNAIVNGTTNISTATNGNANITIGGTSNVAVFSTTGVAVSGSTVVTYAPASATGVAITASGANTQGGTGYADFLRATNASGGATNPNKTFRLNSAGGIEIINSAYSATLLTLTDAGALSIGSTMSSTGFYVNGKQAVNGPAFRAYIDGGGQTITSGSQQKVTFGGETFDTNGNFASSRFTPNVEGYYQLNATVRISGTSGGGEVMITIWKNGSEYARGTNEGGTEQGSNWYSMQVSDLAYANGTGDYFEIYIQQSSGGDRTTTGGQNISYFSGSMVRGA